MFSIPVTSEGKASYPDGDPDNSVNTPALKSYEYNLN